MSNTRLKRWSRAVLIVMAGSCISLVVWRSKVTLAESDLPDLGELTTLTSEHNDTLKELEASMDGNPAPTTAAKGAARKPAESDSDASDQASLDAELANAVEAEPSSTQPAMPAAAEPPPRASSARPVGPTDTIKGDNQIRNIEFKMEGGKSRITVSSLKRLNFREVKNGGMKQVVYFFDNTSAPQSIQRAFDTTEFPSPVALFTLLQMPGESPALSKLIVQLREEKEAKVTESDRGVVIEFGEPSGIIQQPKLVQSEDNTATEENIYAGGKTYNGKTIKRLEIKNSEVQDVLRLIAKTSGYNIVVGDDVMGRVGTLSLEDIPWDQAFALVLQSKKLGYIRQGNVLRVGTLTNLKSEKEEALANEQSRIKVEPLRTVLIPISYAKANEISQRAKAFATERGSVDTDERTNTLIVRDISTVVTRVQRLVAALDIQPPRVSISGKIVEMTNNMTRDVGLNSLNFAQNVSGIDVSGLSPGGVSTQATFGSNGVRIRASRFAEMDARIALGELNSTVRVLANPSMSVVANQQATITSTFTINRPVTTLTTGSVAPSANFVAFPATLNLTVTPIVAGDGSIFMNVSVRNESVEPRGTDVNQNSRSMQTQVLIDNGDTAVIGGLFQSNMSTSRGGWAYLMRIPVLGFLFGGNSITDNQTEIFVFLTAKILNAEEALRKNM